MPLRRTRYTPINATLIAVGTLLCLLASAFLLAGGFKYGFSKQGFVSLFLPALGLPTFLITYQWPGIGAMAMGVMTCCCIVSAYVGGLLGLSIIPIGPLVIASIIAGLVYLNSSRFATTVIR
jgi:hypothetical protein